MKKQKKLKWRWLAALEDLLFPPSCVGCGQILRPFASPVPIFCQECQAKFDACRIPDPAWHQDLPVDGVVGPVSLVTYVPQHMDGMAEGLIYHIKHKNHSPVFAYVASQLAPYIQATLAHLGMPQQTWLVTYPPRRPAAKRKDGFDQAERLAHFVAREVEGQKVRLIRRTGKKVKAQKQLNAKERAESAAASYALTRHAKEMVSGRVVLLLDDLHTTGATLRSCARLLIEAGAWMVVLVTVGKTEDTHTTKHPT